MKLAISNKEDLLLFARRIAKSIALNHSDRSCYIDLVQVELKKRGLDLGMAAGSVFKEKCWEFVGHRKTQRPTSHARHISVWRLK